MTKLFCTANNIYQQTDEKILDNFNDYTVSIVFGKVNQANFFKFYVVVVTITGK